MSLEYVYLEITMNIDDYYYLEIVSRYNVGAIIENPFFRLDHQRIQKLFPESKIIEISKYYTLVVLQQTPIEEHG